MLPYTKKFSFSSFNPQAFDGVNIVVTTYVDGSKSSAKIIK